MATFITLSPRVAPLSVRQLPDRTIRLRPVDQTPLRGGAPAHRVPADVCYSRPATEEPKTTSFVEVDEVQLDDSLKRIFSGWMFAQSPGLNAVEHPIYDVWLINCRDPAAPPPAVEEIPDLSTLQEQIEEGEPLD